jgi:hypothetical protein
MSTIFSDPGWRRGTTLLNRELIDLDGDSKPVAGKELVGQVKIFQDVDPSSGVRKSNRLVYCVAARYTGSTSLSAATEPGKVFAFVTTGTAMTADSSGNVQNGPLAEFSAVATTTHVNTNYGGYGVLDEYLTEDVRQNDVVWLVVKGPTSVQSSGTAIAAGAAIEVTGTAGRVTTKATAGATVVGIQLAGASVGGTAGALVRVNLHSDRI